MKPQERRWVTITCIPQVLLLYLPECIITQIPYLHKNPRRRRYFGNGILLSQRKGGCPPTSNGERRTSKLKNNSMPWTIYDKGTTLPNILCPFSCRMSISVLIVMPIASTYQLGNTIENNLQYKHVGIDAKEYTQVPSQTYAVPRQERVLYPCHLQSV